MKKIKIDFEGVFSASYSVSNLLDSGTTPNGHSFVIANVPGLGKTIFLDEMVESSELDGFIYHETLVHPALSVLPKKARIGLIGGFDGGALKEILKWQSKADVMLLEQHNEANSEKPKAASLNCLIFDLSNKDSLNEAKVISIIKSHLLLLAKGGVVALNGGPASIFSVDRIAAIRRYLEKHFLNVSVLTFPMRSLMGLWSVIIASSSEIKLSKDEFEGKLSEKSLKFLFLNSTMYENVFSPPDYIFSKDSPDIASSTSFRAVSEATETITDGITASYGVIEELRVGETPYQKYSILNLSGLGKTLFIEPQLQSALVDEYIYHECLVHPSMVLSPNPKRVMIAGGGEGATLRDVLKHSSVNEAFMIDIDAEIVSMSKKHLPEWHQGAFDNPRAKIECTDARKWIERAPKSSFDVIISDLSEPVDGGPSAFLFTTEFFTAVYDALTDEGIFVLQAGTADIGAPECFACCAKTLKSVFPIVRPYQAHVTSFLGPWAYVLASKVFDPLKLTANEIETRLKGRGIHTRYYTPRLHPRIFDLPPYIEDEIANHSRILTDSAPFKW